jgi:hypothetical protein
MKTTVEISDALFKEAKRYAAKNKLTFRMVLESGLRKVVLESAQPSKPFKLKKAPFKGTGMRKDFTWDEIMALTDRWSVK